MYLEKLMVKYDLEIKALKEIILNMDKIKGVIHEFDGKIYNKKFDDRLREVLPYDENDIGITVNSYKYEYREGTVNMRIDTRNIFHRIQRQGSIYGDYLTPRTFDSIIIYDFNIIDKRIVAEDWINNLEKREKSLIEELEELKSHNNKEYLTKINEERIRILDEYNGFNKNLDVVSYEEFKLR